MNPFACNLIVNVLAVTVNQRLVIHMNNLISLDAANR